MNKANTRLSHRCALLMTAFCVAIPVAADTDTDTQAIKELIATYATSIDRADTSLADQLFSDAPGVTFINPGGEAHGRDQIKKDVYGKFLGGTFSERKLTPKDIAVHVYGDTAWSEFNWDFVASLRENGNAFHSQGKESQFYHRENGHWRIVHVHYSGGPVTGN